jgi:hypothetical protein
MRLMKALPVVQNRAGCHPRVRAAWSGGAGGDVGEHPRWPYIGHGPCPHYPAGEVGDPVFSRVGVEEMTIPSRR